MNAGSFHTLLMADLAHSAVWSWFSESQYQTGVFHLCLCNGAGGSQSGVRWDHLYSVSVPDGLDTLTWGRGIDSTRSVDGRSVSLTDVKHLWSCWSHWDKCMMKTVAVWVNPGNHFLAVLKKASITAFGCLKRCGWEVEEAS